ncbi:hypothetical protein DNTS_029879 [Danionella cerebrum]|uniref:Ribosomal protein eL8/eL30/eS12/Gadd45 domain-containing protein n=1 Tax=Danionella cerebrum TaxID=2873325 RepID=A0A553RLM4_9TELE|nr:hypothetical protein DNTS_029879 [Danionella translucida]
MTTPAKSVPRKEKKKPIPVKTSLNSPYQLSWGQLNNEHNTLILDILRTKINEIGLRKQNVAGFRDWGKRKKWKKAPNVSVPEDTPTKPPEPSWSHPTLRNQLAIGINEVTKGLERNELNLVLVCSSVRPDHMTSHLIPLSKTRSVPACQVPGLSKCLSESMGLKCVLALGFRRSGEAFEDTVSTITPLVPELPVAWIPADSTVSAEEKLTETESGKKRKLEELSKDSSEASPVTLQPLKVKKIIPNPNKIRKPKVKRKTKAS